MTIPTLALTYYTVRGEITPLKELTEKIANKYGDTENELGWYVPMNIFMYYLVRTAQNDMITVAIF